MKPVTLDLMTQYRYLSDLKINGNLLYYTETVADMTCNNYTQKVSSLNINTLESETYIDDRKRCSTFLMKDGTMLLLDNDPEIPTVHTRFTRVDKFGNQTPAFTLPLQVSGIKDLNDHEYLINATIHRSCPLYHHMTTDEQLEVEAMKKANQPDRLVRKKKNAYFNWKPSFFCRPVR